MPSSSVHRSSDTQSQLNLQSPCPEKLAHLLRHTSPHNNEHGETVRSVHVHSLRPLLLTQYSFPDQLTKTLTNIEGPLHPENLKAIIGYLDESGGNTQHRLHPDSLSGLACVLLRSGARSAQDRGLGLVVCPLSSVQMIRGIFEV